jgi:hypothetical protein
MQQTNENYGRSLIVDEFGDDVIKHARSVFEEYKSRGVLLNRSFDEDVWFIDDEKHTAGLMKFQLGAIPEWIDCSAAEYRIYVKSYIALQFGALSAFTLQNLARELLRLTEQDFTQTETANDFAYHICEFLQLLPNGGAERDDMIERFAEQASAKRTSGSGKQRVLADFQTYLSFNDALTEFWPTANRSEKLFYFPLYFWWNLTTILPLRVTEFLLTPRDCLCGNKLTVRRTKLKGDGAKIGYRLANDYAASEYEISDALAAELREYIAATELMPLTHIDTLLRITPHYEHIHAAIGTNNRYYTYFNLNTCFRSFIADAQVGLDISPIRLGDTRHIAMVNLILSGGSPTICRELAGHMDISVSSHYYTNISTIVECATLRRLRKSKGGAEASVTGEPKFSPQKMKNGQRVNGGFCDSTAYAERDVRDCLKIIGADGAIGDCRACPHYFPDDEGLRMEYTSVDAAKSTVDADSRYLMHIVELVRKGLGYSEEIGTALLRLQHSAYNYSMRIKEKMEYGAT